ncbi:MAG: class I SAM-dependent methyltransferase [Candidatus Hydrogenedentes bacterium]|nr:class I SAM-dependent methyltransferase [Candidatus Hydrogenedentota bacterium]
MSDGGLKSYTSGRIGLRSRIRELASAYRSAMQDFGPLIKVTVERLREAEAFIEREIGIRLENQRILEIGPGQKLTQLSYFACRNEVVGIDLDVIAQGFRVGDYARMLRINGPLRMLKTIARKSLGVDRRFRAGLARELGVERFPPLTVLQMDAANMEFPDASFDFVVSFAVFEHLPEPGRVLDEINRVLKPGGGALIVVHLYTSDNGCHDPRIFAGHRDELPLWSHLRPEHAGKVRPNSYLNKLRLDEWRAVFREKAPSVRFRLHQYDRDALAGSLAELRRQGELAEYTDEELLTVDLAALWRRE